MNDMSADAAAKKRNIETILPLAPLQEGILFHTLMAEDAGVYIPQMAYFLSGPLDPDRLRAAWEQVLARHQALRCGVHWQERDEPFQVVYRRLPLSWDQRDWQDRDAEAALTELFEENRARPFDLRRPPLLRLQLAQTAPDRHILVLCHHHIILDGWSTAQMLQDVMAFYHGRGPVLPPARPYADYIRWLKRQDQSRAMDYWRDLLKGTPGPSLIFGRDSDAPEFDRQEWSFPDALAERVNAFCATEGLTLNTLLQGALGVHIAKALGRDDVFFGSATGGRPATLPGAASMVGLFINALPVRTRIDAAQPVRDWLAALQGQQAATIEHEHVALRDIQAGLGTLFDCFLVVENYPVTTGDGQSDLALERVEFDEWTHFPLTLLVAPGHAGMKLILRRDRKAISDAALAGFLDSYTALLDAITARPGDPMRALSGPLAQAAPAVIGQPGDATPTQEIATETETAIAAIWGEVLKRPAPMASDNFFALGGHSLLAAKVVNRLRQRWDLALPVRVIFEKPVLADLALHVDALRAATESPAEGDTVVEF